MIGNWKLVRLNFGKNLAHFGEVGIGTEETTERVRSDTLFSAWVSLYGRIFGTQELEALLKKFDQSPDQPPFRISSTFIYRHTSCIRPLNPPILGDFRVQNPPELGGRGAGAKSIETLQTSSQEDKRSKRDRPQPDCSIYYVPRPLQHPKGYPDDDLAFSKVYRKLHYLPLDIWQRWYQGIGFTHEDAQELTLAVSQKTDGALHKAGLFDYSSTFYNHQVPKVSIDRTTRATNFYQTGFVKFIHPENGKEDRSGLYFLIHFPTHKPELKDHLYAALELLGEEGLGGERSSGAGRFNATWLDIKDTSEPSLKQWYEVLQFDRGNHHALLSLFWENPLSNPALLGPTARYALKERGGWVVGPQVRRRMVRMFAEGSVFPVEPMGRLADVTPESFRHNHNIYRSGISLSLPISLEDS
jgi:CRISPR-associated protein Csm4